MNEVNSGKAVEGSALVSRLWLNVAQCEHIPVASVLHMGRNEFRYFVPFKGGCRYKRRNVTKRFPPKFSKI